MLCDTLVSSLSAFDKHNVIILVHRSACCYNIPPYRRPWLFIRVVEPHQKPFRCNLRKPVDTELQKTVRVAEIYAAVGHRRGRLACEH